MPEKKISDELTELTNKFNDLLGEMKEKNILVSKDEKDEDDFIEIKEKVSQPPAPSIRRQIPPPPKIQSPPEIIEEKPVPEYAFREKAHRPPRFFNRYPMIAVLFEPRSGGGVYAIFDRVGRFKKKIGLGFEYRLKKKKKRIPTSQFENILESNKGKILLIDHPEEDVFRPMMVSPGKISHMETAWKEIFMNNVERANQLLVRRGFMERYMPLILLIVFGVMMIMALYVVRTDIAIIIENVRSAASSATQSLQARPPL